MTLEAALDAGDLGPQRMVEDLNVLPGLPREKGASFLCFQSLNIVVVFNFRSLNIVVMKASPGSLIHGCIRCVYLIESAG